MQIELFSMAQSDAGAHRLQCAAAVECSGVFDAKWRPGEGTITPNPCTEASQTLQGEESHNRGTEHTEACLMATALADGSLTLMRAGRGGIQPVAAASNAAVGGMTLSCDWDTDHEAVYCSSSNGSVSRCRVAEAHVEMEESWTAHGMEVWMVSCDLHRVRGLQLYTHLPSVRFWK